MKLPIYGWINVRLRMDKLLFLHGTMLVYGWINYVINLKLCEGVLGWVELLNEN